LAEVVDVMPNNNQTLNFTHIHLRNWRNFTEVDVELQRRVFLVGPNACGKSNFLDVFRFLRDVAAEVGGGFQAVQAREGVSKLRCLAARRDPDIEITAAIGCDEHRDCWEYELQFGQKKKEEKPRIRKERVTKEATVPLERPDLNDKEDRERLTRTYLQDINLNRPFRDVAEFFRSVRYLHIVPQLIREPDRSVGRKNDPYGGDFLEQIARAPEKKRKIDFAQIREALRIAVPQLKNLELWRDSRGKPHLRGKYEHWRPEGAWQTEEHFSDGTLRLFGFLWAVLEGTGPLLLEEPELSLHPEIVRFIPQMLARIQGRTGRQILVSSHSSDLFRDEGIGLDEVLLFKPGKEGTIVKQASSFKEIRELLNGGVSLADTLMPHTRPERAEQLSLFGEPK
jgi:predicted ATP-dependent endonuclease of OLD family